MKASKENRGLASWMLAAALALSGETAAQENQPAGEQKANTTVPAAQPQPALSEWEIEVLVELDLLENMDLLEKIDLADYLDLFGKED